MNSLKYIARLKNFTIDYEASLKDALEVMHNNKNGCVVLLKKNKPVGIITESDIINALKNDFNLNSQAFHIASKEIITTIASRPIEFAFDILGQNNIRRIILVDEKEDFSGIVLQEDLFDYLEEDVYKVDLKISDITKASKDIITIDTNSSVSKALKLMQEFEIGSIVIKDEEENYVGIITEKDILKLTFYCVDMEENITKHMTSPIISVYYNSLVTDVISLMQMKSIRRVLIIDENKSLVNILTNRDILKHLKGNYTKILQLKIKHAQEIMDFLPEPIIEIIEGEDKQSIYWMNQKAKDIFGKKLLDKDITNLIPKINWLEIDEHFKKYASINNHSIKINTSTYEISGSISKNLNYQYIKLIFKDVTLHENEKNKLQDIIDIEIKKRLENEYLLMQQSKLATMGEMIGHIAHQWRQPLSQLGGIFMTLDGAYAFNELTPKYFEERINHGNKLLKYMSTTIDDFRNFFEPNREKKNFNSAQYIQNAIDIIHASFSYHHINLEFQKPKEELFLTGFPSEFAQVILNLLANAQDILLEKEIENPKITIKLYKKEKSIFIEVKDNAGGVPEDIKDKIFDMYFTTKQQKNGTGLGLYMAKLIIETKLLGHITVSNDKEGAVFTIKI